MRTKLFTLPALLIASLLAGCGGGSNDSSQTSQTFSQGQATQPSLRNCFTLAPNVQFAYTDGQKILNLAEAFEGQVYMGVNSLRADNTRASTRFTTLTDTHFQFIGARMYDVSGDLEFKYVYSSNYRLPLDMAIGSTIQINATETETNIATNAQTTSPFSETYTFLGFEDITLAGRSFPNTCKLREVAGMSGNKWLYWIAKDFGVIKSEVRNAQDALIDSNELALIISAPAQ